MLLSALLKDIATVPVSADRSVSLLKLDSRQIQKNDLFIAINGLQMDGRKYIKNAIEQGAVAVLVDVDDPKEPVTYSGDTPLIPIPGLRNHLSFIAARFYDFPSQKLSMLGVTGTNGKTSITHFFAEILTKLGQRCGIIGTLGSGFYCELGEAGLTTPDPISLQALLADFVRHQAQGVAMEVSSHSIDQGRINAIEFETGIFTNLTQDHLDYHGSMDTYAAVKRRYLAEFNKQIILNADDPYGLQWAKELAKEKPVYVYATNPENLPKDIMCVYTDNLRSTASGLTANVHTPWGTGELYLPLIGRFNLSNALAVLTALCLRNIPLPIVLSELAKLTPVPGRMQTVMAEGMPLVVVDYAHTPDALYKVLESLRAHTDKKLVCVFGCGGDRDPGKRPLMAKAAEKWADHIILTNDNPRHENPQSIAEQVMQGFNHPERVQMELDRSKAIQKSIQYASEGDCVLIAGKGAERYQQIGDQKFPFDDMSEVRNYLN